MIGLTFWDTVAIPRLKWMCKLDHGVKAFLSLKTNLKTTAMKFTHNVMHLQT